MRRWLPLFAVVLLVQLVDAVPRARAASSTFVVTTTADPLNDPTTTCSPGPTGPCTLRQAINSANANANPADQDVIQFDIPGGGPHRIQLLADLPHITQSVLIDGETETGSQCAAPRSLMIEISGEGTLSGLVIDHAGDGATTSSVVRGMVLNRSGVSEPADYQDFRNANGLSIANGTGHVAECLHIGTTVAGDTARGNARHGIAVLAPATNVRVGGPAVSQRNIIGSNGQNGISIGRDLEVLELVTDVVIQGNYIGVGIDGVTELGNSSGGISVFDAEGVEIGGTAAGEGNVISGSGAIGSGVSIGLAREVEIRGNHIGVSADGTVAVPNSRNGIFAGTSLSNLPITGLVISHNVISGNEDKGIDLWDGVPAAKIHNNIIGLNAAGTAAVGNGEWGIRLVSSIETPVNGTEIGLEGGNIISGNGDDGIYMIGSVEDTVIRNNIIGYAADGTTEIPNNGHGIWFFASLEQIGGYIGGTGVTTMDGGNIIYAESSGPDIANGIAIEATQGSTVSPRGIEIGANSIRSEGHAINLIAYPGDIGQPNAVAPNDDAPDDDSGPNRLQNHPILAAADFGNTPDIELTLESMPNRDYYLRFYASETCNDENARQASRFLERRTVSTNGAGIFSGTVGLEADIAEGEFITATATLLETGEVNLLADLPDNGTSELSNCMAAGSVAAGIGSLLPDQEVAGTATFQFKVLGNGFPGDSQIIWNGAPITTVFFSSSELRATVPVSTLGYAMGTVQVSVTGTGFESDELQFEIRRSSSDINCDGTANGSDALDLLRELAGLTDNANSCSSNADQDNNDLVNILDVLWIRAESVGLVPNPKQMMHNN